MDHIGMDHRHACCAQKAHQTGRILLRSKKLDLQIRYRIMNPIGAQEDEQSGVGCEVDPSPRPDLIRDSSVNCSAGGAFNTVALENHLEGVKKKPKYQDLVENNLGLGKESDETADSWSGSSWKQNPRNDVYHPSDEEVSDTANDDLVVIQSAEERDIRQAGNKTRTSKKKKCNPGPFSYQRGGAYKQMKSLLGIMMLLHIISRADGEEGVIGKGPNNPEILPFRKALVPQGGSYEVVKLNTSHYTISVADTANYTCDLAFFTHSAPDIFCNIYVLKPQSKCRNETGLTVTGGPATNGNGVFELSVEFRNVQRSVDYCIYVQAPARNYLIFSGRVDVSAPHIPADGKVAKSWRYWGITAIIILVGILITGFLVSKRRAFKELLHMYQKRRQISRDGDPETPPPDAYESVSCMLDASRNQRPDDELDSAPNDQRMKGLNGHDCVDEGDEAFLPSLSSSRLDRPTI